MDLLFQAIVLGIVQGLTEFLPISSSGHLIIVPALLGWHDPFITSLAFSVMLHLGTLIALLIYFGREWLRLLAALGRILRTRSLSADDDPDRRLVVLLAITAIPGALVGVALNDVIETQVRAVGLVAMMLVVGAAILWLADRWGAQDRRIDELTPAAALGIGVAQAIALIPGISRSGISIAGGLLAGLDREAAARFSFLMSGPIIGGAVLFEARKLLEPDSGLSGHLDLLVAGVLVSFLAGMLAIRVLLDYVRHRSLNVFVVYRIVLALVVVVWLLGYGGG
jgi:undecaprenyl-diphosphatase